MLTKQKLPPHLRKKFIERLGDVEASLSKPIVKPQIGSANFGMQAPSTQRILDEDHAPVAPRKIPIPTEVVTSTGNGTFTKGPRKF